MTRYTSSLPLLDISAVTFNSSTWLDSFFDSLIAQDYPQNLINVYITDNSSSDGSLIKLEAIKQQLKGTFKDFKIFSQPNLGFGAGHNFNFHHSFSPYFLVTNIDLRFECNSFSRIVEYAIDEEESVASWEFRQKPFEHPKYYNPVTLETPWSSSACVLFRRTAFQLVGGYEPKIFMYGEDVELSYRLRNHGFILRYCPKAVCWHYTYEHENQIKPLQFLGSTLANSYIRLRFGNYKEKIAILFMQWWLFWQRPSFPKQRIRLLRNYILLAQNFLHFWKKPSSRKTNFSIKAWDYGLRRDGAFYEYPSKSGDYFFPLVSVIIRTYKDRLPFLEEAITSVTNQTYENIELIVVEDGSEIARTFVENIEGLTKVHYISIPKMGRCHAGNTGLKNANGHYMMFLDDDDLLFAEHIEVLVNELQQNVDVSAAYSLAWEVDTIFHSLSPLKYEEVNHQIIHRQEFSRGLLLHHNYIPIQSILFHRSLWEKHGGFDVELDCLEDWNLWSRYALNDNFIFINKTTSLYRVPAGIKDKNRRALIIESFYNKALEKQQDMTLQISAKQLHTMMMDFHTYMMGQHSTGMLQHNLQKKFLKIIRSLYYHLKTRFLS